MSLAQAKLQSRYRQITLGFVVLVGLVLGGVVYAGWSKTTIEVIPIQSNITASLSVTVSPAGEGPNGLVGSVTISEESSSQTVEPTGDGAKQAAHARGLVTLHNETGGSQALATGTRLESTDGIIVRTVARVDIPARGTVEIEAVADPLGASGEIPPGRLTIVALRAANQAQIYGTTDEPFTGGEVSQAGTLSIDDLTKASNAAQQKIIDTFGESEPGVFRVLEPQTVNTVPDPNTPSSSYTVTVTVRKLEITYDQAALDVLIAERLGEKVADDQELIATEPPRVRFEDQPTTDSATLVVTVNGQAQLAADSALLQPEKFVNLSRETIVERLTGSKLVDRVTVQLSPWWRQTTASQASRITVILVEPDLTNANTPVNSE